LLDCRPSDTPMDPNVKLLPVTHMAKTITPTTQIRRCQGNETNM